MTSLRALTVITALAFAPAAIADPSQTPSQTQTQSPARSTGDSKADKPAKAPVDKAPADKPPADKSTKKALVSEADAQRFLAFFEKFVGLVVTNQDDCAKMAGAINGLIDANQALLKDVAEARSQNKELPPAIKDKIEKQAREQLTPAITKKCSADKTVQTAFMRMGATRQK